MGLSVAVSCPISLPLGGEIVNVAPLSFRQASEIERFFVSCPGPLERTILRFKEMEKAGVRVAESDRRIAMEIATAQEMEWPPRPTSRAWFTLAELPGFWHHFATIAICPHTPHMTPVMVADLILDAAPGELMEVLAVAFWGRRINPTLPLTGAGIKAL